MRRRIGDQDTAPEKANPLAFRQASAVMEHHIGFLIRSSWGRWRGTLCGWKGAALCSSLEHPHCEQKDIHLDSATKHAHAFSRTQGLPSVDANLAA